MPPKLTLETFISRSTKTHSGFYSYGKSLYSGVKSKIIVTCPNHGDFQVRPDCHMQGDTCPKCFSDKMKNTKNDFISKFNEVHNNFYDYSLVDEVDYKKRIKIICPIHGEFEQSVKSHISGTRCNKCYTDTTRKTTKDFIIAAKETHKARFDYSESAYIDSRTKIKIICRKHGVFEQSPAKHISGSCCPRCKESAGELKIAEILDINNIQYVKEKSFQDCRSDKTKRMLRYDFYIPSKNILIEFDGQQHFKPVEYWNGERGFKLRVEHDKIKDEYASKSGKKLIRLKSIINIQEELNLVLGIQK